MMLSNKNAIVYGAAGNVGAAVSKAFAREGARVFLTGRKQSALDAVAREIEAEGGAAETALVDASDEQAVEKHAALVAQQRGTIDVSFNAIGIPQEGIQGIPLSELSLDS